MSSTIEKKTAMMKRRQLKLEEEANKTDSV
jgi:hypothetical protein